MRRRVSQLASTALLALISLAGSSMLNALPEDRTRAIEISADRAVRDERRGFTVYSGDVELSQGSLRIFADRLTIFHDREAADRIIAEGTPAQMQQQPEIDKALVTAKAGRIVYFKSTERVLLRDAASIEQAGATVTGDSIEYLMREQRVRADANAEDASARVQVVIPAEVIEAQQEDEEGSPEGVPEPQAEDTGSTEGDSAHGASGQTQTLEKKESRDGNA